MKVQNTNNKCANRQSSSSLSKFFSWFDNDRINGYESNKDQVDWLRVIPFILIHIACLGVIYTGISLFAFLVAMALYVIRMFAITGFYHRYFSHRAFKVSRLTQFVFAVIGASAAQRGPLWWASHHRHHHASSDKEDDIHSPVQHGLLRSHLTWFLTPKGFRVRENYIRDFSRYPELRFLDRFDTFVPAMLAIGLYFCGEFLAVNYPGLGTDGPQLLVWGFFISTVSLYHATFLVNSLCHHFGARRYETNDASRNNLFVALLTLGEGWHNNHHHYPSSAKQGFFWWEIDMAWWMIKILNTMGLIHDMRPVPEKIKLATRKKTR